MKKTFAAAALAVLFAGMGAFPALADVQSGTIPRPEAKPEIGTNVIVRHLDPKQKAAGIEVFPPVLINITVGGDARQLLIDYNHSIDVTLYFDFNSANLTDIGRSQLDQLGAALSSPALKEYDYLIAGHTDAKGSRSYNWKLSNRRARAVRKYLIERWSISPERLVAHGWGEERLKQGEHPKSAGNRRVEIAVILPVRQARPVAALDFRSNGQYTTSVAVTNFTVNQNAHARCGDTLRPDPRPAYVGIDDFGGFRSPVPCAGSSNFAGLSQNQGTVE